MIDIINIIITTLEANIDIHLQSRSLIFGVTQNINAINIIYRIDLMILTIRLFCPLNIIIFVNKVAFVIFI